MIPSEILIHRKGSSGWGHDNGVQNWDEVKDWLAEEGFDDVTIIDPSTYSLKEQVAIC